MILILQIIGASTPFNPIDLVYTTSSSELVEVQWLILAIAYTPENYTVMYGIDPALLNSSSDVVVGIKEKNQLYSATLTDLEPNTTYYYQVIARNSIGTNSSDVEMFLTPLPSKFLGFFYLLIQIIITTIVLRATVSSDGIALMGRTFHLTCSVIIREDLINRSIVLQWIGPDGDSVVSMEPILVGHPVTSGDTTSLTLQFTYLFTSHGGRYTCLGDLVHENSVYTVSALQDVIIEGNFFLLSIDTSLYQ